MKWLIIIPVTIVSIVFIFIYWRLTHWGDGE